MTIPWVSVVMPVRNVGEVVEAQLEALAAQVISEPWELVVVDHGSDDDTVDRVRAWQDRLPALVVVDASHLRSVGELRNTGIGAARGQLILNVDGDDVVASGWLAAMTRALSQAPLVTGPLEMETLNDPETAAWRTDMPPDRPPNWHRFLPCGFTCNLGVRRDVVDQVGGFSEDLRLGIDVDFTWKVQEAGYQLGFEPGAVVHRRLPQGRMAWWRRNVRYGRGEPRLYRQHRSAGMPRSSLVRAAATWGWLGLHLLDVFRAGRRYRWLAHCGDRVGRLIGSMECGVIYL